MAWIIRSKKDPDLCWSNEEGWVTDTYDSFSDEEHKTVSLPIEGEWENVPWSVT